MEDPDLVKYVTVVLKIQLILMNYLKSNRTPPQIYSVVEDHNPSVLKESKQCRRAPHRRFYTKGKAFAEILFLLNVFDKDGHTTHHEN